MSMIDWAKREVELACKKENPNRKDGEWDYGCACKAIQCSRMSSLFKYISTDGNITYNDINRVICKNDESDKWGFYSRMINNIINDMFPITMPYNPTIEPYKVIVTDFLFDEKNGDYDTRGILYVVTPDKEKIEINRYFKEENGGWIEISQKEYDERKLQVK